MEPDTLWGAWRGQGRISVRVNGGGMTKEDPPGSAGFRNLVTGQREGLQVEVTRR